MPEPRSLDAPPPRGNGEVVLVVDDDESVLAATSMLLERCGYRVLPARNAGAALEIAGRPGVVIDLLLTDVDMPDTSGYELQAAIRGTGHTVAVLYMSGDADRILRDHDLDPGAVVDKPFTRRSLLEAVRSALARHA